MAAAKNVATINSPSGLAITGTAFWYDDGKTICFGLKNFLGIPFVPGKYKNAVLCSKRHHIRI